MHSVMPGLVPGIQSLWAGPGPSWMAGTSPAMTQCGGEQLVTGFGNRTPEQARAYVVLPISSRRSCSASRLMLASGRLVKIEMRA